MIYCFFGEFLLGEEGRIYPVVPKNHCQKFICVGRGVGAEWDPRTSHWWHVRAWGRGWKQKLPGWDPVGWVGCHQGGRSRANCQGQMKPRRSEKYLIQSCFISYWMTGTKCS